MQKRRCLLSVAITLVSVFAGLLSVTGEPMSNTFTNPVVRSGADPWVIFKEGTYLYCYATGLSIWVNRVTRLQDIGKIGAKMIWKAPINTAYSKEIWAPELHYLDGQWYVYLAADNGDNANHRMYVLEGASQDPQGAYTFNGQITDPSNKWAIDGTVLQLDSGAKYFVWSGWAGDVNVQQYLYIAPLSNPWTISGERVLISQPELPWELIGKPLINEGPEVLKKNGKIFIIYSASGSWTDDYCLGQLTLMGDNPLNPSAWVKKETPVFSRTDKVFGPGHASFTTSPDGTEDWIVYHSARTAGAGWDRNVSIQKFGWDAAGNPDFGRPTEKGIELAGPSGQE